MPPFYPPQPPGRQGSDGTAPDEPPDDERKEWRQLWDDVDALLKKVEEKK